MRLIHLKKRTPGGRSTDQSGFTLLEVLFALAIMGIGMLAIGLAQISALKMTSKSRSLSQAMYLAQEQIDTFLALPDSDVFFTTALTDFPDPSGPIDVNANDGDATTFTRRWTVIPNSPSLGMTTIRVNVQWDTATGVTHEIHLDALKRLGT